MPNALAGKPGAKLSMGEAAGRVGEVGMRGAAPSFDEVCPATPGGRPIRTPKFLRCAMVLSYFFDSDEPVDNREFLPAAISLLAIFSADAVSSLATSTRESAPICAASSRL